LHSQAVTWWKRLAVLAVHEGANYHVFMELLGKQIVELRFPMTTVKF
jgi:hypothetical protein